MRVISETITKVTYGIRYPSTPEAPVQAEQVTEDAFRDLEADDERVPDWMDPEYVP